MSQSQFPTQLLLPARAAGLSEILDAGVRLFRLSLLACLPWSLLSVLFGQLPSVYLLRTGQSLSLTAPKDFTWWILMVIAAMGTLWCWLAIMLRQRSTLARQGGLEPRALAADLRKALQRLPVALGALAAGVLAVALGTLLLVIPGIYLLVAFWPALALVVFEGCGVRAALDGSLQLVRGAWRHLAAVLVVVLMALLGLFVIGNLVGLGIMEMSGGAGATRALSSSSWVSALLSALFLPLLIALGLAAYADLRHRRDQASSSASSSA